MRSACIPILFVLGMLHLAPRLHAQPGDGAKIPIVLPGTVFRGIDSLRFGDLAKPAAQFRFDTTLHKALLVESREQGPGLSPVESPFVPDTLLHHRQVMVGRAGFGRFASPRVDLTYGRNFPDHDILAHFNLDKSLGHVQNADHTTWMFGLGGGGYLSNDLVPLLAKSRVEGSLDFQTSEYGLFGNTLPRVLPDLTFRRRATTLRYGVDLQSRMNPYGDFAAGIYAEHLIISDDMLDAPSRRSIGTTASKESWVGMKGRLEFQALGQTFRAEADYAFGAASFIQPGQSNPLYLRTGILGSHLIQRDLPLEYGAALYVYKGTIDKLNVRIFPTLSLKYLMQPDISLFADITPRVEKTVMSRLVVNNPYLMAGAALYQTEIPLEIRLGAGFDQRPRMSGRAFVFYSLSSRYPVYAQLAPPIDRQWNLRYDGITTMFGATLEGTADLAPYGTIMAGFTVRTSWNDALDGVVPYLPAVEGDIHYTKSILKDFDGTVELVVVGTRATGSSDLPAYVHLNGSLEYRVTTVLGVYASCVNLFDTKWQAWRGYDGLPFFFTGGFTFHL